MPHLDLPSGRIWYDRSGNGSDLVLMHNGFESSRTWEPLLPRLTDSFRVTRYDRAGFGRSQAADMSPESDIVRDGGEELGSLLDALQIEKTAVIAHCLGAASAFDFIARNPGRITAIVSEACGFYGDRDTVRRTNLIFQPWEDLTEDIRRQLVFMHGEGRAEALWNASCTCKSGYVMHPEYDLRPRLAQIACPALLLSGADDFLFSPEHTRNGAAALPEAAIRILEGVGHDVHREAEERFLALALPFLREHTPRTDSGLYT